MNIYILKPRHVRQDDVCAHCGKPLEVGDKVVSNSRAGGRTKRYHEQCFDKMWLDL